MLMGVALAALLMSGGPASAQARQGGAAGDFDFYVLALSWSPGFCASEDRASQRQQCAAGLRHTFVVHGLWPQYERGYPRACGARDDSIPRDPSRRAMSLAAGIFPEQGLARHQWRMHGTCSGNSPETYFRDTARARSMVTVPQALQGLVTARRISPEAVERAFIAANPGLRPDMIATACAQGRLKEVRLCLKRDLSGFTSCPEVDRNGCRARDITIDAPR